MQCLRLVFEKRVSREYCTDVHNKIVYRPVSRMHDVCLVLERVVDALDDAPLTEHDFVPHGHEPVLHVGSQSVYKMYSPCQRGFRKEPA